MFYNIHVTPMPATTLHAGHSAVEEQRQIKRAICFWVIVAGVALIVANALAAVAA